MDQPHTLRELRDAQGQVVKDADGNPVRVPDSTPLGGPLWVYRLQWDYVYTMLTGHYPNGELIYRDDDGVPWYYVQPEPWLDEPAFYQFSVETWADDERMKHVPGLRLGGFITVYPSPDDQEDPLTRFVLGDEVLQPDAGVEAGVAPGEDERDGCGADTAGETLLSPTSTALYSPYVSSWSRSAACAGPRTDTPCQ